MDYHHKLVMMALRDHPEISEISAMMIGMKALNYANTTSDRARFKEDMASLADSRIVEGAIVEKRGDSYYLDTNDRVQVLTTEWLATANPQWAEKLANAMLQIALRVPR